MCVQLTGRGSQQRGTAPVVCLRPGCRALNLGRLRVRVLPPSSRDPAGHRIYRAGEARRPHVSPKLPAVAVSLAPASFEVQHIKVGAEAGQQGFASKAQSLLICAYDVDCDVVTGLGDDAGRALLGLDLIDLACAWEDLALRGRTPPS